MNNNIKILLKKNSAIIFCKNIYIFIEKNLFRYAFKVPSPLKFSGKLKI
jgi:hypothetical protein